MSDDLARAARAWLEDCLAFGVEELPRVSPAPDQRPEEVAAPAGAEPVPPSVPQADFAPDLTEKAAPEVPDVAPPHPTPADSLEAIAAEVAACTRCGLAKTRTKVVPGQGAADARFMFVGEAPGADEDRQGLAFVGRAGQLLTKMIQAMGLEREQVFIANVLKCRPPGNRDPRPDEVACCVPFLRRQIDVVRPGILIALGAHAARNLLNVQVSVGRLRGRVHEYHGTPLIATYHPAYLLRSPEMKGKAWDDLKLALRHLGMAPPPRKPRAP